MGKSAPSPPDYGAAAEKTAAGNLENLKWQTAANRPTQITPWGTVTWESTPETSKTWVPGQDATQGHWEIGKSGTFNHADEIAAPGRMFNTINRKWVPASAGTEGYWKETPTGRETWTQTVDIDPDLQAALDAQIDVQRQRSEQAQRLYGRAEESLAQPFDSWKSIEAYGQDAEDAAYKRALSRLDPRWGNAYNDKKAELVAMGLRPGDDAYDRAMQEFDRSKNDAYSTATWDAIEKGNQLQQSMLAQRLALRNQPLNEINALLTGQQVQMPQFPGYSNAGYTPGPDYMGATDNQYQAELGAYSAKQAGLQGLFGGIGSIAGLFSDRRLKKNIMKVGEANGLSLYIYEYLWGELGLGHMSDEVSQAYPGAVLKHSSGFDMVDYRALS